MIFLYFNNIPDSLIEILSFVGFFSVTQQIFRRNRTRLERSLSKPTAIHIWVQWPKAGGHSTLCAFEQIAGICINKAMQQDLQQS